MVKFHHQRFSKCVGDDFGGRNQFPSTNQVSVPDPSAIATLEETLETRIMHLGPGDPATLQSMRVLGDNYLGLGMKEKGIAMFRRRLEAGRAAHNLGPENPNFILLKNDLALAYSRAREFEEAVKIGEEINAVLDKVFAPEDTNFLTMRYNLGYYYEFSGKLREAVVLYEEVLAACRATNDYEHRVFLITLVGLEALYVRMGRANDSLKICQEIVDVYEKLRGESDPATLAYMKLLAKHYLDRGRPRINDAVAVYARIVRISKTHKGAENTDTLVAMSDLANAYRVAGQKEEAKKVLRETLEIRKRVLGPTHRDTLQNMDDLVLMDLNPSLTSWTV